MRASLCALSSSLDLLLKVGGQRAGDAPSEKSVVQAEREHELRELRQLGLIDVVAATEELRLRIEPGVLRPRVEVSRGKIDRGAAAAEVPRVLRRHVVRER